MSEQLEQLVAIRSQLAEEVLAYLKTIARDAAVLPKFFPAHLRDNETGQTHFDNIRQMVQVVKDRTTFEQHPTTEWGQSRAVWPADDEAFYRRVKREALLLKREALLPLIPWDEQAGDRFRRAIILADPGFGKTWLLRYEARRLAEAANQVLAEHALSLGEITLPIFVRLPEVNHTGRMLEEELLDYISRGYSSAFRDWARQKLETERCVILLDGWDEVPVEVPEDGQSIQYKPGYRQRLGQRLVSFVQRYPHPRLLLTSRIVGYSTTPLPQAKELELVAFGWPQIRAFIDLWFGQEREARGRFLAILQQNPNARGLARIPLMLALMSRAYHQGVFNFPWRRVDLFQYCLHGLLRDWKEEKEQRQLSMVRLRYIFTQLAKGALHLLMTQKKQFTEDELAEGIGFNLESQQDTEQAERLIESLKRDGIFVRAGEYRAQPRWLFMHHTFHEYLAAYALAQQANNKGWETIAELVSKNAWLPSWEQVITMLTGQLQDPTPLFDLLSNPLPTKLNPHGDDIFRHRLTLITKCLPETLSDWQIRNEELVTEIGTAAFALWWAHLRNGTEGTVEHLQRALSEVVRMRPIISSSSAYMLDLQTVFHPESFHRFLHERLQYGQLDRMSIQRYLAITLLDSNINLRVLALKVVRIIGPAIASPEIIRILEAMTQFTFSGMDRPAHAALAAVRSEEIEELVFLNKRRAREAEARGRGKVIGSTTVERPIIDPLIALRSEEDAAREVAVRMLEKIKNITVTSNLINELTERFRDADYKVRAAAAKIVRELGHVTANSDILDCLTQLLGDVHPLVQRNAAETIRGLGASAMTPDFLNYLAYKLMCEHEEARFFAALTAQLLTGQGVRIFTGPDGEWEAHIIDVLNA